MRSFMVLAAAFVAAAVAQDGKNGNFCGNVLGSKKALVDPIKGTGKISFPGMPMPFDVTVLDGQIVTTILSPGADTAVAAGTMVKMTECIYDVGIDFATNELTLITGAPNTPESARRCWTMQKGEDNDVDFVIHAGFEVEAGSLVCTDGDGEDPIPGTISNLQSRDADAIPKALKPGCDFPAPEGEAGVVFALLKDLVVAGNQMWMNDKLVAVTADVADFNQGLAPFGTQVWQQCLVGIQFDPETLSPTQPITVGLVVAAPPSDDESDVVQCMSAELNPVFGIARVAIGAPGETPECPEIDEESLVFSVAFRQVPAVVADLMKSATAAAGVKLVNSSSLVTSKRDVVETTLSGITLPSPDLTIILDPCNIFKLRAGMATALQVDVMDVKLTVLDVGGTPFSLASDSSANLINAACPPRARRLREQDQEASQARGLQGTSVSAGVQIIAPPGGAAALATTVGNVPLATALGPFAGATNANIANAQSSPPIAATAIVVAAPVPINRPIVYTPSSDIKQFHSIPRFILTGGGTPTSAFSTEMTYLQGALFPAGGIIAFGVIFFIVYIIAYLAGCCKCCCRKCRPKRDPDTYYASGLRKHCGTPRALVVMAIINAALLLSVIAYLPKFTSGIDKVFSAANDFADILTSTGTLMKDTGLVPDPRPNAVAGATMPSMKTASTLANTKAIDLLAQLNAWDAGSGTPETPSTVIDIVEALRDGTDTAADLAEEVGTTLSDAGGDFKESLDKISIETIKTQATLAGYVVLGFLAFVVLFWSVMVCKSSCAACVYKFSAPIVILLTLLVAILSGAYYAIGIVGSDVCIDPPSTLMSVIGQSGDAGDSLKYYLQCGNDPAMAPIGAAKQIRDAVDQISLAAEQTDNLNAQVEAERTGNSPSTSPFQGMWDPNPGVTLAAVTYLAEANDALAAAKDAVEAVADTKVSCQAIDTVLQKLFVGLCNEGFGTIIAIFRITIAAAVLLICQLGVGVDVCCYHPGDSGAWGGDDKATGAEGAAKGGAAGMTVRTAPAPAGTQPVPGQPPAVGASKV